VIARCSRSIEPHKQLADGALAGPDAVVRQLTLLGEPLPQNLSDLFADDPGELPELLVDDTLDPSLLGPPVTRWSPRRRGRFGLLGCCLLAFLPLAQVSLVALLEIGPGLPPEINALCFRAAVPRKRSPEAACL
jgi:hypothetical protein